MIEYAHLGRDYFYIGIWQGYWLREYALLFDIENSVVPKVRIQPRRDIAIESDKLDELATILLRKRFPMHFEKSFWFLPLEIGERVIVMHPDGKKRTGKVVGLVYQTKIDFPANPIVNVQTGKHRDTVYDYHIKDIRRQK